MNNLTKVIGPAPSEMDRAMLFNLISLEHKRVQALLEKRKITKIARPAKTPKIKPDETVRALHLLAKDAGVSVEELLELMKEAKSGN